MRRWVAATLLIAVLALLVGCGAVDDPQNTFAAEGDVARKQRDLLIIWVLGPAAVIFVVMQALLIYAIIRFRRKKGRELPRQVHGNNRLEIAWTIAPAILLLIITVPTVVGIIDLGRDAADDALRVRVVGQQFSWTFQYPDLTDAEGNPLTVIGLPGEVGKPDTGRPAELHIPVDREIGVTLESVDVIHSFWVPKLAGKLDVIPGRTNSMWFNATKVGSYSGQCAEFCGVSPEGAEGHWTMRLTVVAESEEDFEAWVADQLEGGGAARSRSGEPVLVSHGE
ncbi:MAG: cytochrome c oxidase subunit II [Chloroflexi bacterium]|nr:cytochrome c oxidase subunit II [Chloroflexota bacterium]